MKPSLIVHGGAWDIPDALVDACKEGCRRALAAGWSILTQGGSALDAVTAAIVVLEDDPVFDAGYGSHLNLDGQVECDAIVMDGATLRAGSIAAVKRIRNPIRAARALLEHGPHMMLVAEGAERYAKSHGIELCDPKDLVSPVEKAAWQLCKKDSHAAAHHRGHEQGTVGAVALDSHGSLLAATSTGGTCCKLPGRVGDSPLIGCGCYADAEAGAASATGHGESIMKVVLTKYAVDLLRASSPHLGAQHAAPQLGTITTNKATKAGSSLAMLSAQSAIAEIARRTNGTGGIILLDHTGTPGFAHNTPRMAQAHVAPDGSFVSAV